MERLLPVVTAALFAASSCSVDISFSEPNPVTVDLKAASAPPSEEILAAMLEDTVQIIYAGESVEDTTDFGLSITSHPFRTLGSGVLIDDDLIVTAGHVVADVPYACSELEAQALVSADGNISAGRGIESGLTLFDESTDGRDIGVYALDSGGEITFQTSTNPEIDREGPEVGQVVVFSNYQYESHNEHTLIGIRPVSTYSGVVATVPHPNQEGLVAALTGLSDLGVGTNYDTTLPGASGGPVYDSETGKLIGITSAILDDERDRFDIDFVEETLGIDITVENGQLDQFGITYFVPTTSPVFIEAVEQVLHNGGEPCN